MNDMTPPDAAQAHANGRRVGLTESAAKRIAWLIERGAARGRAG